jgi:hypothetical protein
MLVSAKTSGDNHFLGVMGSFGRLDLRATDLLAGDVSNGRGQTLNLGAQRGDQAGRAADFIDSIDPKRA